MYSTCLFCNASLGANATIEHFPVGRRLAYDSATGRLWVVCKNCDRWNLSPLESRWEAIEEAERQFRATKTRVATDNIGLARLSDGTELVRIGKPPQLELAVWRYGDQFKKRNRKLLAHTALIGASVAVPMQFASSFGLIGAATPFYGAVGAGVIGSFLQNAAMWRVNQWRYRVVPIAAVRDANKKLLRLTQDNINAATLMPVNNSEWVVGLPHVSVKKSRSIVRMFGSKHETESVNAPVMLDGATALQALATILPRANRFGATNAGIKAAVDTIQQSRNLSVLLKRASEESVFQANRFSKKTSGHQVAYAPEAVRLALEMSLHTEDERRAMEGELQQLEQRWRDADAIAKISDEMFLPDSVDAQLRELRADDQSSGSTVRNRSDEPVGQRASYDDAIERARKS